MKPDRTAAPICWHADSFDPNMASVRLRVLQPMRALQERSYAVREFRKDRPEFAAIIFSKSSSKEALSIAEAAAQRGRPIAYDVCDNIFEKPSASDCDEQRKDRVRQLMRMADVVTCTTRPLAELLAREVPEIVGKVEIIPDALEETHAFARRPTLFERIALWQLRLFLRRHRGSLHLVWFGKCKKGYAGIEHLGPLVELLERLPLARPVTLTVISNRRKIHRRCSAKWRVRQFYMPWSLATFDTALRLHEAAVIPIDENGYTIGKTLNRPGTALMAGLGVIADPIPAYEEMRPFIFLGDWEGGLQHYGKCPPAMDERIAAAQAHLRSHYGSEAIAEQWARLIDRLAPNLSPRTA